MSATRPAPLSTTGIGSLPHTQLELALQQSLVLDVPYLPELPCRAASESLAPQALEHLPGLRVDEAGRVSLDGRWEQESGPLEVRLEQALESGAFEPFAPSPASSCAWPPFLWEVAERKLPFAKVQCAGPATALAALAWGGRAVPERLAQQVQRLVLVRALAMASALRHAGAIPIVFLDEPLLGVVRTRPALEQARELELLRETVVALRNQGAITGLHCCGEADWAPLLRLGLDVLSFDATTSLRKLLVERPDVERFLEAGGWFGLGVVPTDAQDEEGVQRGVDAALDTIGRIPPALRRRVLAQSLVTPACGLATRSVRFAGLAFDALRIAQARLRAMA